MMKTIKLYVIGVLAISAVFFASGFIAMLFIRIIEPHDSAMALSIGLGITAFFGAVFGALLANIIHGMQSRRNE